MKEEVNFKLDRRQLLKWSTPVIAMVAVPAHAQTSPICVCSGPPLLSVSTPPKCSGNPPIGTAEIEILAADDCGVILKALSVTTDDAKSDLGGFPMFPTELNNITPESISWMGPASDGTTCLPLATISLTIDYCCAGDPDTILQETYNITQLLLDSTNS